jgi:6-phosphogluconolactonase
MSNDASGNAIVSYLRGGDGNLTYQGAYATGGKGSGGGLGSQGTLVYEASAALFFAVNAGDNSISMLSLNADGSLTMLSNVSSGGVAPDSITVNGSTVYVLNQGDSGNAANITGFTVAGSTLTPLSGSTQALSAANPSPTDIAFTPDGSSVIVAEKGTDLIDVFPVTAGVAGAVNAQPASGTAPFALAFDAAGDLLVTDANPSATASYAIGAGGALTVITAAVVDGQAAACWLAVVGSYGYVANAHSSSISSYSISSTGTVALLNATAGSTGAGNIDLTPTSDGRFLYQLDSGDNEISIFLIHADGSLTAVSTSSGTPAFAAGLVAL